MSGHLQADELVLCGELEKDLKVMVGYLVEECRRRGLQVNADTSKMMVLHKQEISI